jgi:hypothetical protein
MVFSLSSETLSYFGRLCTYLRMKETLLNFSLDLHVLQVSYLVFSLRVPHVHLIQKSFKVCLAPPASHDLLG